MERTDIRVLLVEDNPGDAFLVRTLIEESESAAFYVVHCETAAEAEAALRRAGREDPPFDVVLLDLTLPDSSGVTTIRRVRAANDWPPIVVLTGLRDERFAIEALRHGAEDYLTKDYSDAGVIRRSIRYAIARRRDRVALQESEERYRRLVELAPELIAMIEPDGRLGFINGPGARMLGCESSDALEGQLFQDLLHGQSREGFAEALAALRRRGDQPIQLEARVQREDGDELALDLRALTFHEEGRLGILIVASDVTDRKRVQRQLVQTSKLATLGEMAASVAHEVNQPLNIIRMAADSCLMEHELGRVRPDFQREKLGLISDQTQRMAEIVQHMRIYSRRDDPLQEPFDPFDAVRRAVEMTENDCRLTGIDIETVMPEAPATVLGHAVQLEQVLVNLLTNARDAVSETREDGVGGLIRVTGVVGVEEGLVSISVHDNGGGIPAEALELIFDPFFTTKDVGRGTGLGLSVSQGIIEGMGGQIDARNEGEGACFEIVLPLHQADRARPDPAAAPAPAGPRHDDAPHHLLAVDDEGAALRMLADYLRTQGYRVSQAENADDALALFAADPPDLLITDIRMPGRDGNQLIRDVLAQKPGLPVVVMTGHPGDAENRDLLRGNRGEVLSKPVDLRRLSGLLQRLLDGSGGVAADRRAG